MLSIHSSVQAGAQLLAAAMRDPAPILRLSTFWDFMKVVKACASELTDAEKASPLYQEHIVCFDRIYQTRNDMLPVSDDHMQLGEHLTEALAEYMEQAVSLLPLLLERGDAAHQASLRQEFVSVFSRVVQDIEEVPGGPAVQQALTTFKSWTAREQADELYIRALDLYDQQRYTDALALLGQALLLECDDAHLYYTRGNVRGVLGDYRGAAAEYHWAVRHAPYYVSAYNNLGNTYEALSQYEKSVAQYQRALHIDPDSTTLHYNLGGVYHTLGRLPEALDALSTAISLDPTFAGCYLNRANILSQLGKQEEALADYRQALALEPDDSNTAWTATWAQFGREDLTNAQVVELERISRLDSTHYTSHCCLAVLALHRVDTQAALLHLEQAVKMEPDQWDPHFWIGIVAAMSRETEVARHAIERSLDLGLPPVLLTPLFWLKDTHADFFGQYAQGLLQRFGV